MFCDFHNFHNRDVGRDPGLRVSLGVSICLSLGFSLGIRLRLYDQSPSRVSQTVTRRTQTHTKTYCIDEIRANAM